MPCKTPGQRSCVSVLTDEDQLQWACIACIQASVACTYQGPRSQETSCFQRFAVMIVLSRNRVGLEQREGGESGLANEIQVLTFTVLLTTHPFDSRSPSEKKAFLILLRNIFQSSKQMRPCGSARQESTHWRKVPQESSGRADGCEVCFDSLFCLCQERNIFVVGWGTPLSTKVSCTCCTDIVLGSP